jgi:hypothetical protein
MPMQQQPQMQPMAQDPMMGMPAVPPQELQFQPPPVEGYYGHLLAESVKNDPNLAPGQRDWRHDALDRFAQIEQKLDAVRAYIDSGDTASIMPYIRDLQRKTANV